MFSAFFVLTGAGFSHPANRTAQQNASAAIFAFILALAFRPAANCRAISEPIPQYSWYHAFFIHYFCESRREGPRRAG